VNVTANYVKVHKSKVVKNCILKYLLFILVKRTEVLRNVREQAHRTNQSDSAPVSIKEQHAVPEDPG
jgi:hypothetical protein